MSHPLIQLTLARYREFIREPAAVFWVYGFPLLMTLALGIAFRNRAPDKIHVAVVADDASAPAIKALQDDSRLAIRLLDQETAKKQLRSGKVEALVQIESASSTRVLIDPTRPGSPIAKSFVDDTLQRAAGRVDPLNIAFDTYEEPGGRYIDFLVPGLLGMGVLGGGLWGVGFAIVELRIGKLLKRYMATPLRRSDFLMSMMLSRLVFTIPEVLIILVFSWLVFDVRCYGNIGLLIVLVIFGAIEFAGLGLLISSRAKTLETVSGLMNLAILPMWLASGIFFSTSNFPEAAQPFLQLLPLTPLIDALRGVMRDGEGLLEQLPRMGIMAVWTIASFALALKLFRWNDG
jgi:ABC-2 type transport system permease protein